MYNKVILVGNLTRDIELRYSQGGMAISKTALATNRKFSSNGEKKEEVCFVDITFFGRSAEIANQYLRRGSKILVEGRLTFEQWVDQNNQKRSKHSVTVENMQMLDSRSEASAGEGYGTPMQQESYNQGFAPQNAMPQQEPQYGGQQQNQHFEQNSPQPRAGQQPNNIPEIDIDEDEIPF